MLICPKNENYCQNKKNLLSYIKWAKRFGNFEIEKNKFHCYKDPVF